MAISSSFSDITSITLVLLFVLSGSTAAASFDCSHVTAPDEKAICADRGLSEKDVRMATIYKMLQKLMLMGGRGALQDEQTDWLQKRRQCESNTVCLSHLYDRQIGTLSSQFQDIATSLNR